MQTQPVVERARDLERFLTFIDAVVAIAITLLVLPLVDLRSDLAKDPDVLHLLRSHSGELIAFIISFIVIAKMWLIQHRAVADVIRSHPRLVQLLMLWAFTIVMLPFCTSLLAGAGQQIATKVLYFATIGIAMACIAIIKYVLRRHPDMLVATEPPDPTTSWINVVLLAVGLLMSILVPRLSYFPLLLLLTDDWILKTWRRWRPRASV